MDWIFDHLQIFVFVLIGIGSLVKTTLESKANAKRESEARDYKPREVIDPDKSFRKTIKATISPKAAKQAVIPPKRESGYEEAAAIETARALKHQQDLAERLRQIRENKATTTGGAAATRARISSHGAIKEIASPPLSVRARLRDPAELRRAIVMREILNVPVGLR